MSVLVLEPVTSISSAKLPKHDRLSQLWQKIDRLAIGSLYDELNLELKPGLVCPSDNGSHLDMDYHTFVASIDSLVGYFDDIAQYGHGFYDFESIRRLGLRQEHKMRLATDGANTHKGAIFNLGFIAAASGRCVAEGMELTAENICQVLVNAWQHDLLNNLPRDPNSHGQKMHKQLGITGAIELVAGGFEPIRNIALPCYYETLYATNDVNKAKTQTLMSLIAHLDDTNLAWRGGVSGLRYAQNLAMHFLIQGGVYDINYKTHLVEICQKFVIKNLSAGGSADLLAATLFLVGIENEFSGGV